MSISSPSELELSLISLAGSGSTLTGQGGHKKREKMARGVRGGGDYSKKAINRGMAIIRGNTVSL